MVQPTHDMLLDLPFSFVGPDLLSQGTGWAGPAAPPSSTGGSSAGLPRTGFLDSIVFALTGTPDALLTPEDARDRAGRRRDATQLSVQASQDPGEGFMWAPTTGGSGFGLNDIIRLFASAAGGAGGAGAGGGAGGG